MSDTAGYFRDGNMERIEHSVSEAREIKKDSAARSVRSGCRRHLDQVVYVSREGIPKISWSS